MLRNFVESSGRSAEDPGIFFGGDLKINFTIISTIKIGYISPQKEHYFPSALGTNRLAYATPSPPPPAPPGEAWAPHAAQAACR